MKSILSVLAFATIVGSATASVKFNEFLWNPPGTDQGQEFAEIISSSANESLNGVTLVVIEGDGTTVCGIIDQAIDLSAFSTGSNKLFLIRDTSAILLPGPEGATTQTIIDFTPDIENGTNTYLLVRGFSGSVGQDLDTDNDGVLDIFPWTSVDDAFGVVETATNEFPYGASAGGVDFPFLGWTPGGYHLLPDGTRTALGVAASSTIGPYTVAVSGGNPLMKDINNNQLTPPGTFTMTPGAANMALVNIVNPTSIVVTSGMLLGGNLASIFDSDNNRYLVICDEFDSTGQVRITTTGVASVSVLKILVETSAARNDLSQFVHMQNVNTNLFDLLDVRNSTLVDNAFTVNVANPGNYLAAGTMVAQVTWIPQNDVDAADGWSMGIDRFVYDLTP